jgi:hypothetical protein
VVLSKKDTAFRLSGSTDLLHREDLSRFPGQPNPYALLRMDNRTPTQLASEEMARAIFADPELRERFEKMAFEATTREPVPDDFTWLANGVEPESEFSRPKASTQQLASESKVEAGEVHRKRRSEL